MNIIISDRIKEEVQIEIFDTAGREMYTRKISTSEEKIELDNPLPAGIYYVRLTMNGNVKMVKLVSE